MLNHYSKLLIISVSLFILASCTKDSETSNENSKNIIEQIKLEFDKSNFKISPINFSNINSKAKKSSKQSESLNIDWDGALIYDTNDKTVVELPVASEETKIKLKSFRKNKLISDEEKEYSMRLIYEKLKSGKTRFYIVTLIDKTKNIDKKTKFYKNNKFSGIALISDINGNYRASYEISNGKQKATKLISTEDKDEFPELYKTIQTENDTEPIAFGIRNNIYIHCGKVYEEGAIIYCSNCDLFIVFSTNGIASFYGCANCGVIISTSEGNCPECGIMTIPSVSVEPIRCGECRNYLAECVCCEVCERYHCICYNEPPTIYRCVYCQSQYCNGSCRESGGSGGSSSGGGDNGETDSGGNNQDKENETHSMCPICNGCKTHRYNEKCSPCICDPDDMDKNYCMVCGACIDLSNGGTQACVCSCEHEICQSCGKYISPPLTRSTALPAKCQEHEYCKSTEVVCECGERHLDSLSQLSRCLITDTNKPVYRKKEGYNAMWDFTKVSGTEIAGYLTVSVEGYGELVVVNDDLSVCTEKTSQVPDVYRCTKDNTLMIQVKKGDKLQRIVLAAPVHTHPKTRGEVEGGAMSALFLSDEDRGNMADSGLPYGLILNNHRVFKYTFEATLEDMLCPIIETF